MKFLNTEYLFLVWILPLLALAYLYGWRKRTKILNTFAVCSALDHLVPIGITARRRIKAIMVLAALLLIIVAIAGPQYGFKWKTIEREGVDIILALDCSRSMLATDIQPTRLDRAKREIFDLLNMLQGDRVGLVAYSGTAFLQCPLTMDYTAFYLFLDVLTPDYLPVGGTDLAAAIQTAQNAFDPESKADRAMILITDGENTGDGNAMAAAQAAEKAGIKLFCIGVGSAEGVPVPNPKGGFKKDVDGQIVLSRLDQDLLTRMALATGGTYVQSVAGDMDLDTIYRDQIRAKLTTATVESGKKQVWADRFQWPLSIAVTLLLITVWVPSTKRSLAVLVLPLLFFGYSSTTQAGPMQQGYQSYQEGNYDQALEQFVKGQLKSPDDPKVLYNLGNTYYKKGDFGAAADHYGQALSAADETLKPKLLYNLANSIYRQGKLEEAIQNYEAVLKLAPEDHQAKENLAFAKKQLEQQKQQQQDNQDNNDQKQDGDTKQQPDQSGRQQEQNQGDQNSGQDKEQQEPPPQYGDKMDQPPPEQSQGQDQPLPEQNQADAAKAQKKLPPPGQPASAQMLNRLKDEPGKAMMQTYEKRQVDKDW